MQEDQTTYSRSFNVKTSSGPGFGFWLGLILIVVGGGLLLEAFQIFEFGDVFSMWWPSLLMIIAIAQVATRSGGLFGSGILFTVGALLQLSKLGYLPGGFWSAFWPIILILIGLSFIGTRFKKKERSVDPDLVGTINVEGSRVNRTAIFTGINAQVSSQDFTGGELTAIMGGIELDLRNADISGKAAFLDVTAIMGGIELHVPPHWNIVVTGTPIFGGIDDKSMRQPKGPDAPTLMIDATAIMGGVEIH